MISVTSADVTQVWWFGVMIYHIYIYVDVWNLCKVMLQFAIHEYPWNIPSFKVGGVRFLKKNLNSFLEECSPIVIAYIRVSHVPWVVPDQGRISKNSWPSHPWSCCWSYQISIWGSWDLSCTGKNQIKQKTPVDQLSYSWMKSWLVKDGILISWVVVAIVSRWWCQICLYFRPLIGEMIQFDSLKPPTRYVIIYSFDKMSPNNYLPQTKKVPIESGFLGGGQRERSDMWSYRVSPNRKSILPIWICIYIHTYTFYIYIFTYFTFTHIIRTYIICTLFVYIHTNYTITYIIYIYYIRTYFIYTCFYNICIFYCHSNICGYKNVPQVESCRMCSPTCSKLKLAAKSNWNLCGWSHVRLKGSTSTSWTINKGSEKNATTLDTRDELDELR